MTFEEAVEQILKGGFIHCKRCDGSGYYSYVQIHDEISMQTCEVCEGKGSKYRTNYLTACKVLQREPAPLPNSKFVLMPEQEFRLTSTEANVQNWGKWRP